MDNGTLKEYIKTVCDLEISLVKQKQIYQDMDKIIDRGRKKDESSLEYISSERPPVKPELKKVDEKESMPEAPSFIGDRPRLFGFFTILAIGAAFSGAAIGITVLWVLYILIKLIVFLIRKSKYKRKLKQCRNKKQMQAAEFEAQYEKEMQEYAKDLAAYEAREAEHKRAHEKSISVTKNKLSEQWNSAKNMERKALQIISETQAALNSLYGQEIIYPKYRNLVAVAKFYEYLDSGRCEELTGAHGAYNLYEDEIRKDMIIINYSLINLRPLAANQYYLYSKLSDVLQTKNAVQNSLPNCDDPNSECARFYSKTEKLIAVANALRRRLN